MTTKIIPITFIQEPLSVTLSLIRSGERTKLSLSNFIQIASDLTQVISKKHENETVFPLSLKNIDVSYHRDIDEYSMHTALCQTKAAAMFNIFYDKHRISPLLEALFTVTEIASHGKIGAIISYILANELQAFRLRCDHYQNKNTAQTLSILLIAFVAMQKLCELSPQSQAMKRIDILAIQQSGSLPKILGNFLQKNTRLNNFDGILARFLIENTTSSEHLTNLNQLSPASLEDGYASMSKSAYRKNALAEFEVSNKTIFDDNEASSQLSKKPVTPPRVSSFITGFFNTITNRMSTPRPNNFCQKVTPSSASSPSL